MTRQELYIDGVLADIDEQTNVTLNVASNLFRDITQMIGNNSYTIQLPPTSHNKRLVADADIIARRSQFPYLRHTAKYIRDGVPVIPNGIAVLMGIGERIEIVITWGVSSALSSLVEGDANLNDINTDDTITFVQSPTIPTWDDFDANDRVYPYFFALADYNKPLEETDKWNEAISHGWTCGWKRPVVRVPFILRAIYQQYGVTFDFSEVDDVVKNLVVPLVHDKPNALSSTPDVVTLQGTTHADGEFRFSFTSDNGGGVFNPVTGTATRLQVTDPKDITFSFDTDVEVSWLEGMFLFLHQTAFRVQIYDANNNPVDDASLTQGFKIYKRNETTIILRAQGTIDVSLQAGWSVELRLGWENSLPIYVLDYGNSFATTLLSVPVTIKANGSEEHVQFGQEYPITSNLPEIKITDFIKTLACVTGTFPLQPTGDVVRFVSLSTPWNNINGAVDWTRRVIPAYEDERPRSMAYTIQGYARDNNYKWKDVDGYDGELDGTLNVPNDNLAKSRDVITLPFAVPKTSQRTGEARIPIYEISNYDELAAGGTTPTYNIDNAADYLCTAFSERVVRHIAGGGTARVAIGTDGLNLQSIIDERYRNIEAALTQTVIIKERVRLSDVDVMEFDATKPVYLAQYGAFFAVLNIQSNSDGTAEVEMLAMISNNQ